MYAQHIVKFTSTQTCFSSSAHVIDCSKWVSVNNFSPIMIQIKDSVNGMS